MLYLHTNAHESLTNFSKTIMSRIIELKNLDNNSLIRKFVIAIVEVTRDMKAICAQLHGNYMFSFYMNAHE